MGLGECESHCLGRNSKYLEIYQQDDIKEYLNYVQALENDEVEEILWQSKASWIAQSTLTVKQ